MRLLVTGGSGFLGGYVLDEARRRGHEVVALARSDKAADAVAEHGAEPLPGDFDDPTALPGVFSSARCSSLLNIASLGFGHAPAIVAAARAAGIDRAVFVSTTAVTTRLPARSKQVRLDAERQIRESGLKWTIVRPTMIYGAPGDRNLSRLLAVLARMPVLPVPGGGRHLQQPVHVADVAGAVLSAAEEPATIGATYDLAGPEPLPFTELLRIAARAVGSRTRLVPVPLAPVLAAARCYEWFAAHPRIRAEQIQRLAEHKAFAIDDAARDLGFAPRPFAEGIMAEAIALGLAVPGLAARDWPHGGPRSEPRRIRVAGPHGGAPATWPGHPARAAACPARRPAPFSARPALAAGRSQTRPRRSAGRAGSARSTPGCGGTGRSSRPCARAASSCSG